ncbi:MAG: hypothetical protein ACTSRC_10230 [Candidatus Helarchaeota archaeon]
MELKKVMPDIPFVTLLFGLLGTISLHLAKAFTRQGIDTFKFKEQVEERKKKSVIWIVGFVLNNIVTVFVIIGVMFGPAAIYNSVYGVGLVVLLFYAYYIMNENISSRELLGAILIIIGTVGIGILGIFYSTDAPTILYNNFYTSIFIILPIFGIIIAIGYKFRHLTIILFASVGGTLSAVGSDFMYIGNIDGGFAPNPTVLLPVYVLGLLLGTVSFFLSQIAFYREAEASKYVSIFNGLSFLTPFIYELFIFQFDSTDLTGLLVKIPFIILVLIGIYFIIGILIKTIKKPPLRNPPQLTIN